MKEFKGKLALVTGAGSGIGQAVAIALAQEGAMIAVTDLNEVSAAETAELIHSGGGQARAFPLDVSDPIQIMEFAGTLDQSLGTPSVLVNNAGIAVGGYFPDTSLESWEKIVSINLMGVVHCCRAFVPAMVESGRPGHVANIASMLGYTQARGATAYCTTKYGVLGFSESLRAELGDHDIGVTAICPGIIHTNIINSSILESRDEDIEEKRKSIDALYEKRNYTPERVAQAVIRAIRKNRAVVPVTPEAWLAYYLKRWTPWLVRWITSKDIV
jgi:NAD(P)-dependent dehydrogenase (short-subunit alcohol dehydrogenase family)